MRQEHTREDEGWEVWDMPPGPPYTLRGQNGFLVYCFPPATPEGPYKHLYSPDGPLVPPEFQLDILRDDVRISIAVAITDDDHRAVVRSLQVEALRDGEGFPAELVRRLSYTDAIHLVTERIIDHVAYTSGADEPDEKALQRALGAVAPRRGVRRAVSDDRLPEVASAWRAGQLTEVAKRFAVSTRTAARLVDQAEHAGLVTPDERPRKYR